MQVLTYSDVHRERNTTVLKCARVGTVSGALGGATVGGFPRPGNTSAMRVIGIQSGNAVDGNPLKLTLALTLTLTFTMSLPLNLARTPYL